MIRTLNHTLITQNIEYSLTITRNCTAENEQVDDDQSIHLCITGGGDTYQTTIVDYTGIVWRRFEKAFEKTFARRHGYRLDWICDKLAITIILSNPHMDQSYQYVAKKITI